MSKTEVKAHNLIEETTLNNYHQSNEWSPFKKARGKSNVDALTLLNAKMDAVIETLIY